MTDYYKEKLEQGLQYQDFIMDLLIKELGITLSNYSSKKYQYNIGENKQGIEIKNDDKFKTTGNIYIETAEKSNADNISYVASGIYRSDNTWLYVIGDYELVYIFSKKYLVKLHEAKQFREVTTPTSKGMLLDKNNSEKYCIKKIEVEVKSK